MSQTVLLNDLIDIKHGFAFKGQYFCEDPTDDILITPGNFAVGGGFKQGKLKYYRGPIEKSYVLQPNSMIVTMTDLSKEADTLGFSARVPIKSRYKFLHNQRIGLVTLKNDAANVDYLYWLMRSKKYRDWVVSSATGSTVKHTSPSKILGYRFHLPDLETQKKIADVLGAIDEKIELNRRVNETLEQIGQALFRHYFIDNPEAEKWGEATVNVFASHLKTSISPAKSSDTVFNQYSIPAYDNSYSPEVSRGDVIKSSKYKVEPRSILASKLNPATPRIWAVLEPKKNAICSTEFQVIVPISYYAFCYFLLTSKEYTDKMAMSAGGTSNSHRRVKPSDILNYSFANPDDKALEAFEQQIMPSLEAIGRNREQIQILTTLRDTLLPRLISGKVKF